MKRRIAAAVLYAVVSALGPGDATAAINSISDDDDEESSPSLLALISSQASAEGTEVAKSAGGSEAAGRETLLKHVSRALGTPLDAAWVVRNTSGHTAAVAVQADPHRSVATIHAEVTPPACGIGEDDRAPLLRLPLAHALAHCRERGYLKVILTADGAAIAPLRRWVESRGFQFSRGRWLEGAPAVEFYVDLYWSGGEHAPHHDLGHAA